MEKLARVIFTRYLLAFEVTSVLLVIAVVGAVVLARRSETVDAAPSGEAKVEQRTSPPSEEPLSEASDEPLTDHARPHDPRGGSSVSAPSGAQ